jgi:prevent-host-death family protein
MLIVYFVSRINLRIGLTGFSLLVEMKKVNIHEAKTHLSDLVRQVKESGASYLICRNGEPVADLVPHARVDRMTPHPVMSHIEIRYDPTEPLSDDEWPEE